MTDNTTHLPRSNTAKNNRSYGFRAETELMHYLRDSGLQDVEKLSLSGAEDEGDLVALSQGFGLTAEPSIIQLKTWAPKSAKGEDRSLSPTTLRRWLKALQVQCENYRAHRDLAWPPEGMLIVKIKGYSWDDAFVISRLKDWL